MQQTQPKSQGYCEENALQLAKEYRVVSALRADLEESLRQLAGERFDEYLRVIEAHGRITRKLAKVL